MKASRMVCFDDTTKDESRPAELNTTCMSSVEPVQVTSVVVDDQEGLAEAVPVIFSLAAYSAACIEALIDWLSW